MDEIEERLKNNFAPLEQNLKQMEVGLSWLWNQIYKLLSLILTPLEKGINWLIGNTESNNKGDEWF